MALMHKLPLPTGTATIDAMLKTKTLRFLDLIPEQFTDRQLHERFEILFKNFTRFLIFFSQGRCNVSTGFAIARGI